MTVSETDYIVGRLKKGLDTVPAHMYDAVWSYVMHGRMTSGFLMALLSNDLKETVRRADDINGRYIKTWVHFIVNYVPVACQGSADRVRKWQGAGGFMGIQERERKNVRPEVL